jgi:hypothetical protein
MKRILAICCLSIILSGCQEKKEKINKTQITNNYLLFGNALNIPYSKPIKQQKIIGSEQQSYQSDTNGFITSVDVNHVKIDNNYETNKSHFFINNKFNLDLNIEQDENKNIHKVEDAEKKISWIATYDEQYRIIKIERISNPTTISHIFYDKGNITKIVNQFTLNITSINSYSSTEEKHFLYNNNNQLSKIMIKVFDDTKAKPLETKKCTFYDYNENGDWTKAYCLKLGENYTYFNLREIDY